jgi:hypothetical protein
MLMSRRTQFLAATGAIAGSSLAVNSRTEDIMDTNDYEDVDLVTPVDFLWQIRP